jgi:hypothetical protein
MTPWSTILFEKLKIAQLAKKFPAYGTRKFISKYTELIIATYHEPLESYPHAPSCFY